MSTALWRGAKLFGCLLLSYNLKIFRFRVSSEGIGSSRCDHRPPLPRRQMSFLGGR